VLSRRPVDIADAKLKIAHLNDFRDYSAVASQFAGYDACLWCLGVSQTEVSKQDYEKSPAAMRLRRAGDAARR